MLIHVLFVFLQKNFMNQSADLPQSWRVVGMDVQRLIKDNISGKLCLSEDHKPVRIIETDYGKTNIKCHRACIK